MKGTVIEANVQVNLPCGWATQITREHGAVVNCLEQKDVGNGLLQCLVEIYPGEGDPETITEALGRNPSVVLVESVERTEDRIIAALKVRDCRGCHTLARSECFMLDATTAEGAGLVWRILAPKRADVRSLVEDLAHQGIEAELTALRSLKASGMLTKRQETVTSFAYKLGYFEFPKEISLSELAKKLGVAKSTVSEILRKGEAKVLHSYFHGLMRRGR